MDFRYMLVFLILSQLAFADCIGYTDSFDVRVLDAKLRPIPGAEVWVKYDRGTSFGEQYYTTPIEYTDSQGQVHFTIYNQGTTTRKIDCSIWVSGSIGGSTRQEEITANAHGPTVDIILDDVYPVKFYVRDHLNAGIPNASVTLGDIYDQTNENGLVKYYFKIGDYDYLANYLEARESGVIKVEDDVEYEVVFPYYNIEIDVTDDQGTPLPATITLYNETFELENGHFENEKSFGEEIPFEVEYKGLVKSDTIVSADDPTSHIVYDIHAPLFDEIVTELSGDLAKIIISVTDPGDYPSGIDVSTIKTQYRMEPADPTTPWNTAVVFSSGYNVFTAQLQDLPPNSIVGFKIEIKDNEGNLASIDGKFSTLEGLEPVNDTENQTETQNGGQEGQEIPLFYIIGGIILLILIVYLGIRIKSKGTGGT